MDMQIKRENRETEQLISLKPVQTMIEAEVTLPGSLRDEARVYFADATVEMDNGEITGSRVMASGKTTFHVLFAQGDLSKVQPLEATADFTQSLTVLQDVSEIASAQVKLRAQVLNVSAKVFNGRLALRAAVNIQGDISAKKNVGLIVDLGTDEHVQQKNVTLSVQRTVGSGEAQSTIRDEIELSDLLQIKDTLLASGYAVVEDIKMAPDGKARVLGTLHLDVCHTSDMPQRPLISTVHTLPYEQEVVLSGAAGDILSAQTSVQDVAVMSRDGSEQGEKTMRCEIVLRSTVQSMQSEKLQLLQDAYTISGEDIDTRLEKMSLCAETVQEETAESGRVSIVLPEGSPRVRQPLLGFARPVLLQSQRSGGKLHVSGMMEATAVYLTDESVIPVSVAVQTPFSAAFITDAMPDDQLHLHLTEPVLSAVTGDRLEIKYILHMRSNGVRTHNTFAVTEATSVAGKKIEKGISLCFVQPGETLWDIAKRYRMPVNEITAQNPECGDNLSTGDALLIYRRENSQEKKEKARETASI